MQRVCSKEREIETQGVRDKERQIQRKTETKRGEDTEEPLIIGLFFGK